MILMSLSLTQTIKHTKEGNHGKNTEVLKIIFFLSEIKNRLFY
jgi:hypothetical protein